MSALTMARLTPQRLDGAYPTVEQVPMASGATIFVGALVCLASGLAVKGQTATGLRAVGVMDNQPGILPGPSVTSTVSGFPYINVKRGTFKFVNDPADPIAASDLFKGVYITDDQTVCKTPTGGKSFAGVVKAIDSSTDPTGAGVWVSIGELPTSAPAPTGLFLP